MQQQPLIHYPMLWITQNIWGQISWITLQQCECWICIFSLLLENSKLIAATGTYIISLGNAWGMVARRRGSVKGFIITVACHQEHQDLGPTLTLQPSASKTKWQLPLSPWWHSLRKPKQHWGNSSQKSAWVVVLPVWTINYRNIKEGKVKWNNKGFKFFKEKNREREGYCIVLLNSIIWRHKESTLNTNDDCIYYFLCPNEAKFPTTTELQLGL